MKSWFGLLAGTISIVPAFSAQAGPTPKRYQDVTLTTVSEKPPFVSGFLATAVELTAIVPGQGETKFYMLYFSPDQAFPKPGETCDLAAILVGFDVVTVKGVVQRPVATVSELTCGAKAYDLMTTHRPDGAPD